MTSNPDTWLRFTAWFALLGWAIGEWAAFPTAEGRDRGWARVFGTLGAVSFLAHVGLAMQFRHHWSHASAMQETERQTVALFGIRAGYGVWMNYGMAMLWSAEAARSWIRPRLPRARMKDHRTAKPSALHLFFGFMWLNAAVVFPSGAWRLLGLGMLTPVAWSWWFRRLPVPLTEGSQRSDPPQAAPGC